MINFKIDLETIPDQRPGALDDCIENLKPPGNIKKPESIQKWLDEKGPNAAAEAYHKTGLNGLSGEVASVAWALGSGEPKSLIRRSGQSEALLLQSFFDDVLAEAEKLADGWPHLEWIGFNILNFDIPFLPL